MVQYGLNRIKKFDEFILKPPQSTIKNKITVRSEKNHSHLSIKKHSLNADYQY